MALHGIWQFVRGSWAGRLHPRLVYELSRRFDPDLDEVYGDDSWDRATGRGGSTRSAREAVLRLRRRWSVACPTGYRVVVRQQVMRRYEVRIQEPGPGKGWATSAEEWFSKAPTPSALGEWISSRFASLVQDFETASRAAFRTRGLDLDEWFGAGSDGLETFGVNADELVGGLDDWATITYGPVLPQTASDREVHIHIGKSTLSRVRKGGESPKVLAQWVKWAFLATAGTCAPAIGAFDEEEWEMLEQLEEAWRAIDPYDDVVSTWWTPDCQTVAFCPHGCTLQDSEWSSMAGVSPAVDAYKRTVFCRTHGFARIYVISGPTADELGWTPDSSEGSSAPS